MLALLASDFGQTTEQNIVTEDSKGFVYIGHSGLHDSQKDALNEAYLEAVKEAIRHSFGFKQNYIENYLSTTESAEIFGQMNLETGDIYLNGITPLEEKITQHKNGRYSAIRKIHYDKTQRSKEIARQASKNKSSDILNIVNSQSSASSKITITTNPAGVLIDLIGEQGKIKVSSTSNALFHLPIGKYTAHFHLNNYLPLQSEIIVGPGENKYHFTLKRGMGSVRIKTHPAQASMFLNGLPLAESTTKLPVGIDYTLTIDHPDFYPETRQFSTWFNDTVEMDVRLRARSGSLTLSTLPEDSTIQIDQRSIGMGRVANHELAPGSYLLSVNKNGYESFIQRIEISANKNLILPGVVLEKARPKVVAPVVLPKRKTFYFNHQFAYMPFSSHEGENFYYHLPVSYHYQMNSFFAIGAEAKIFDDTAMLEEDSISEQLYSIRSRYTILRFNAFKLSVGADYNQRRTVIIKNKKEVELRDFKGLGASGLLQIPLISHKKGLINLDLEYRRVDFQSPQSDFINIGVSFEF